MTEYSLAIVTLIFFAFVLMHASERRKLRLKIADIEGQLHDAKKETKARDEEIKHLKWQLDNPPKFKKGDKFGDLVVTDRKIKIPSPGSKHILANLWLWQIFKKGTNREIVNKLYHKHIMSWEYELTNTATGDKSTMNQFELETSKYFEI